MWCVMAVHDELDDWTPETDGERKGPADGAPVILMPALSGSIEQCCTVPSLCEHTCVCVCVCVCVWPALCYCVCVSLAGPYWTPNPEKNISEGHLDTQL